MWFEPGLARVSEYRAFFFFCLFTSSLLLGVVVFLVLCYDELVLLG